MFTYKVSRFHSKKFYVGLSFSVSFFVGVVWAPGCKSRPNATSGVKHTLGAAVRDPNPHQWVNLSPKDFSEHFFGDSEGVIFLSGHPVRARPQRWVDAIHDRLIENKAIPAHVPRSYVVIQRNSGINAFVSAVTECFDIQFQPEKTASNTTKQMLVSAVPTLNPIDNPDFCINRKKDLSRLHSFVDKVNHSLKNADVFKGSPPKTLGEFLEPFKALFGCRFFIRENTFQVSPECDTTGGAALQFQSDHVAIQTTHNVIAVYSGALQRLAETEVISIIAHELGHYYHADFWRPEPSARYFYKMSPEKNLEAEPARLNNPVEIVEGMRVRSTRTVMLKHVPGAKFFPEVTAGLFFGSLHRDLWENESFAKLFSEGNLVSSCQPGQTCETVSECRTFRESYAQAKADLERFPGQPLDVKGLQLFSKVQEQFMACAQKISPRDPFDTGVVGDLLRPGSLILAGIAEETVHGNAPVKNLAEFVNDVINPMFKPEALLNEDAPGKVKDLNLAWYTEEQEADEFGIEAMAAVGLLPDQVISMFWNVFKAGSSNQDPLVINNPDLFWSFEKCKAFADKGWMENGKPVYVPLGAWTEPHHSLCFRIYNMTRETEAHKEFLKTLGKPPELTGNWKTMVEHL